MEERTFELLRCGHCGDHWRVDVTTDFRYDQVQCPSCQAWRIVPRMGNHLSYREQATTMLRMVPCPRRVHALQLLTMEQDNESLGLDDPS